MLKHGRVVALDSTSELLKTASANVLQFKTDAGAACRRWRRERA